MGIFNFSDIFGGGKVKTDWEGLQRYLEMQNEMGMKNKYGLFSDQVWEEGPDGRMGMRHSVNPALQGGMESLMGRMSGETPQERYSSPSQLNQLLDARMAHQFDRSGMQYGQGPDPQRYGPSSMPGGMPPPPPGPPQPQGPQAMPAQQPQGGGMVGPRGGGQPEPLPGRGGLFGSMFGGIGADQRQAERGMAPQSALNQTLDPSSPFGAIERAFDQRALNKTLPEDQRRNAFMAMFRR